MYPHFSLQPLSLFSAADSLDSTMTTWQRNVTISSTHAASNAHVEDDVARQQTCHVVQTVMTIVVTAPIAVSDSPPPFLFSHRRQMTWQPTTVERRRHMTDTYDGQQPGEQHELPPPAFLTYLAGAILPRYVANNNNRMTTICAHPVCIPIPHSLHPFSQCCSFFGFQHSTPPIVPHSPRRWGVVLSYIHSSLHVVATSI
jgi:hypothetical protein